MNAKCPTRRWPWQSRELDRVIPWVIDAIVVKVRDGQVRRKPFYEVVQAC